MRLKVLLVEKKRLARRTLTHLGSHFIVGRKNSNLNVADRLCSQQHFVLYQGAGNRLWLKDLASTNGTRVNGKSVNEAVISLRDEIRFGETLMVVLDFEPVSLPVERTQENSTSFESEKEDRTVIGMTPIASSPPKLEAQSKEKPLHPPAQGKIISSPTKI